MSGVIKLFNVRNTTKMALNFIRDSWATALQPALAFTGYIASSSLTQTKNKINQPQIPSHDLLTYPLTLASIHHPTPTAPVHIPQLVKTSQLLTALHNLRSL
jgi:hypothetical protein